MADLRKLSLDLANIHREWCRTNLEAWQKAKDAVDQIERHPNEAAIEAAAGPKPEVPAKDYGKGKARADETPFEDNNETYGPGATYGVEAPGKPPAHPHHDEQFRADLETERAAAVPLPLAESEIEASSKHDGPLGPL